MPTFPPLTPDRSSVDSLIAWQVIEQRRLEYKQQLPDVTVRYRSEFLGDGASFINTAGGFVLYGFAEERTTDNKKTGAPSAIAGLPGLVIDAEVQRLESMIRDGLAHRLRGVTYTVIEHDVAPVLAIDLPVSHSAPHMVTFHGQNRFYARGEGGKFRMDVHQI